MKHNLLIHLCVGLALSLGTAAFFEQPVFSQIGPRFFCDPNQTSSFDQQEIWLQYGSTQKPLSIVTLRQEDFPEYNIQTRCRSLVKKFQEFLRNKNLRHISNGFVGRYPVWCVASPNNDMEGLTCHRGKVLITFKPGTNARRLLEQRFAVARLRGVASSSGRELTFETNDQIYVDIDELIFRHSLLGE
jgi:hypothetical protein